MKHHLPADIEKTSMEIITEELAGRDITLQPGTERVVRRVIHTTADFDYAENLLFLGDPVIRTEQVLQRGGAVLVTDTNMA
ncbi:MAG: precorrin-8X methylmutase, partial [Acutalibacteraceae bacterium]